MYTLLIGKIMLKGEPIGLKVYMNKKEMKEQLQKKIKEWENIGISASEIAQAIISKCKPLIYGYYWSKYPESCKRLAGILNEMKFSIKK